MLLDQSSLSYKRKIWNPVTVYLRNTSFCSRPQLDILLTYLRVSLFAWWVVKSLLYLRPSSKPEFLNLPRDKLEPGTKLIVSRRRFSPLMSLTLYDSPGDLLPPDVVKCKVLREGMDRSKLWLFVGEVAQMKCFASTTQSHRQRRVC